MESQSPNGVHERREQGLRSQARKSPTPPNLAHGNDTHEPPEKEPRHQKKWNMDKRHRWSDSNDENGGARVAR